MLVGEPHGESMFEIPHRMSIGIAVTLSSGNRFTRANKPKALSAFRKGSSVDVQDVRARHLQFCWQTKLFLAPTSWGPCLSLWRRPCITTGHFCDTTATLWL